MEKGRIRGGLIYVEAYQKEAIFSHKVFEINMETRRGYKLYEKDWNHEEEIFQYEGSQIKSINHSNYWFNVQTFIREDDSDAQQKTD